MAYLIINDNNLNADYRCFWTGGKWHDEYPEAEIYTSRRQANATIKKMKRLDKKALQVEEVEISPYWILYNYNKRQQKGR